MYDANGQTKTLFGPNIKRARCAGSKTMSSCLQKPWSYSLSQCASHIPSHDLYTCLPILRFTKNFHDNTSQTDLGHTIARVPTLISILVSYTINLRARITFCGYADAGGVLFSKSDHKCPKWNQ